MYSLIDWSWHRNVALTIQQNSEKKILRNGYNLQWTKCQVHNTHNANNATRIEKFDKRIDRKICGNT